MKIKTLLFVLFFTLLYTAGIGQITVDPGEPIEFLNSSNISDGTEIVRQGGNALRIRYFGNPLRFEALDDKPFQIRNSPNTPGGQIVNVEFDPNGGKSFIMGKLGVGFNNPQVLLDLNLPTDDPKAIRFRREAHPTYELRLANSKGLSIFNQTSSMYEMVFGGNGTVGIGENFNPQAYLHITQGPDKPYAIKLSRDEGVHTDYELFIGSSQGLNIKNSETGDIDMVFGGDKTIGIGTLTPATLLHLHQQNDPKGLRFERNGHKRYELRLANSKGLHIVNVDNGTDEMMFDGNGKIGIGTTTPTGKLQIVGDQNLDDAGLTSPGGFLVLGNTAGQNLSLDNNEIMARSNGSIANLGLQADGGSITVHGGSVIPESEKIHITGGGNVGIGTLSPVHKLDVVDNSPAIRIRAKVNDREIIIKPGDGNIECLNGFLHLNRWSTMPVEIARGGGNVIMNGGGKVGIGTENPAVSAVLDIQSTNKGVLVPRLQRTAVTNPATSLLVYDTDDEAFFYYDGADWIRFIAGSNDDADADPTNELQDWNTLPGIPAAFADGTDDVDDADANIGNEYNTGVSLSGNTLSVMDGGGAKTVDLSSLVTVEADPQVGANAANYLPKWDGSALVRSTSVFEDASGNVGIGTTTIPSAYKFAVDGKIIAEEVKVRNSNFWPDHVFEKDYPLLPLEELEKSIQQNGHLPGVPSAAEVQANGGVEVGDMQRRLLEKIEELTLYILQLEKRIKELEEKK